MGQVPKYGIIGDGRVAKHFSAYFNLEKIPFSIWSRHSTASLSETTDDADIILLLIKDGAIDTVINENPSLRDRPLVHFSGSFISKWAWGAHPLMSFAQEIYSLEFYRKIPFIIEEGHEFKEYFPSLKNPYFSIKKSQKDLYHALCVLSGNSTTILWNKLFESLETNFNIPREAAYLFLDAVVENLKTQGAAALTGPIVRGDVETMKRNLKSLDGPYEKIYRAISEAGAEIFKPGDLL